MHLFLSRSPTDAFSLSNDTSENEASTLPLLEIQSWLHTKA